MNPFLFVSQAAVEGDAISVSSAVLLLLAVGLAYCVKALADLRREVADLRQRSVGAAAATPAPVAAAASLRLPPTATPAADEEVTPELLAAIAAAVATVIDGPHRVAAVSLAHPENAVWSQEGRRHVFQSHKVR